MEIYLCVVENIKIQSTPSLSYFVTGSFTAIQWEALQHPITNLQCPALVI